MPPANLQVTIAAKDESSRIIHGIGDSVSGLSEKVTHLGGLSLSGIVGSLGALGLAGFGVNAIGSAISGFVQDAVDADKVAAQLNAVLTSTKGISGMTADSVTALANSLSQVTPFEDEAITSAESMLLTFTGIGKQVFPDATEAVLNMSQALGQDLQSSAIQLGKALNDPIAGVTALQRVGVRLTDTQKELVKKLMDSGDLMGAQKVILGELTTEFGGAARAAGDTFAGKMTILNTQIGNVKEAIGGPLLTVIGNLITGIVPAITAFADGLPNGIAKAQAALEAFAGPILGRVTESVKSFLSYLSPANTFDLMRAWFGGDIGPKIDVVVRAVKAGLADIPGIIAGVSAGFTSVVASLAQLWPTPLSPIIAGLRDFATAALATGEKALPGLIAAAEGLARTLMKLWPDPTTAVGRVLAEIGTTALNLGGTALPMVIAGIDVAVTAFGKFLATLDKNSTALSIIAGVAGGLATAWALMTAASIAHTVALGAETAATGILTAAQGVLNLVMEANPIGLIVVALAALASALIVAYNTSDTFRAVVDSAFAQVKVVVQGAVNIFNDLWATIQKVVDAIRTVATVAANSPLAGIGTSLSSLGGSANLPGMGGFAPSGATVTVNNHFNAPVSDPTAAGQMATTGVRASARALGYT